MMKTLFKIMASLMMIISFSGCSDNDEPMPPSTLPITYANIDGIWQLAQWNGQPTPEGTYCYIVFSRKERTFSMYQKFDSMYPRTITGTFVLEDEDDANPMRAIISGTYHYGMGTWNHTYLISELTEEGTMLWTATDDETDVCLYQKCEELPEEVK